MYVGHWNWSLPLNANDELCWHQPYLAGNKVSPLQPCLSHILLKGCADSCLSPSWIIFFRYRLSVDRDSKTNFISLWMTFTHILDRSEHGLLHILALHIAHMYKDPFCSWEVDWSLWFHLLWVGVCILREDAQTMTRIAFTQCNISANEACDKKTTSLKAHLLLNVPKKHQ